MIKTKLGLLVTGSLAAFSVLPWQVQAAPLNDTAMVQCLDASNQLTSACTGTGQDGAMGRDVTKPKAQDGRLGFSFTKLDSLGQILPYTARSWACVRDNTTGLIWEVKTDDGGPRDKDRLFTNHGTTQEGDAGNYVQLLGLMQLCGREDWRMPSLSELQGILDYGMRYPGPLIDTAWFPNTPGFGGSFWAREPFKMMGGLSWIVSMGYGDTGGAPSSSLASVRPVSNKPYKKPKYAPALDGVEDVNTALVWQRCSLGQTELHGACIGSPALYSWRDAISAAQAAGSGWRLPNAKELQSAFDLAHADPAVNPKAFPGAIGSAYWSSTPSTWTPGFVEAVVSNTGQLARFNVNLVQFAVRLVRDAE